jgi:hypothetical protein
MTTVSRQVCTAPPTAGPITGYRTYGCRCYRCGTASSAYDRGRRDAIKDGVWQPLVDARPVIDHLLTLRKSGVGATKAAKAAGVAPDLVTRYVSDRRRPLPKRIRAGVAEALLQVTPLAGRLAGERVPSLGSRRRARALSAIGWSMAEQASRVGLERLVYSNSINRSEMSAGRAALIREMYERLSGTPGPSERARVLARRRGWAAPLAWDDVDMDDPKARPCNVRRRDPRPLVEGRAA